MITLHDLFLDLSTGEFANIKLGDHKLGDPYAEPDPRVYAQLIRHINLGLTALHTEFLLRAEEVFVTLYENITTYNLDYRYAVSNVASSEPVKYITDTVESPWNDNLLKIEEIYDEEGGLLYINDPEQDLSLYTPRFDQIQVPWPNSYNTLGVQYRADHPTIVWSASLDPTDTVLVIPRSLREALLYFVAARIFQGMGAERPEAQLYWAKYADEMQTNWKQGLYIETDLENNAFTDNGWS